MGSLRDRAITDAEREGKRQETKNWDPTAVILR
jgi:hypothetical protein